MQTIISRNKWLSYTALLLVLPTVYFIIINILKFEIGVAGPYDAVAPFLESAELKESFGWNINLLLLLGPQLGLLLAGLQVVHLDIQFTRRDIDIHAGIEKKWLPLSIMILGGLTVAALFFYMIIENCNC